MFDGSVGTSPEAGKLTIEVTDLPPHSALLVGDFAHDDFHSVLAWLRQHSQVVCASSIETAEEYLTTGTFDLCLLAQARPGLFLQADVERLHRVSPLTPLAVLAGAWCEGEPRTGTPLSGIPRIYWHEAIARLATFDNTQSRAAAGFYRLPRTALPTERTLAITTPPSPGRHALVAVRAQGPASFGALADACKAIGYAAVWLLPSQPGRVQGASWLLWEGDVRSPEGYDELRRLATSLHPAPTIALLNFPRDADRQRALEAGAVHILAKPFLVSDLSATLHLAQLGNATLENHDESRRGR